MSIQLSLLIISCLAMISCRQTEKSIAVSDQAVYLLMDADLEDDIKYDSSLVLVNQALAYDDQNVMALNHKAMLLFRKKDAKGILQILDQLFEITDNPNYLGQKARILELEGDSSEAKAYYAKALHTYQAALENAPLPFDRMLDYVSILHTTGDSLKGQQVLADMKKMDLEAGQPEILDSYQLLYQKAYLFHDRALKFWKGEIEYDQIDVKLN